MSESMITDEMIDEFNLILEADGSIIRLDHRKSMKVVDIVLVNDRYLPEHPLGLGKPYSVYPNKAFYNKLADFFKSKGIEDLGFNNSHSTFWKFKD